MIEEFKVIGIDKYNKCAFYKYKFKLNSNVFYSYFWVYTHDKEIIIRNEYHDDLEIKSMPIYFSKEEIEQMETFILNQKEIRLRHLLSPYTVE